MTLPALLEISIWICLVLFHFKRPAHSKGLKNQPWHPLIEIYSLMVDFSAYLLHLLQMIHMLPAVLPIAGNPP